MPRGRDRSIASALGVIGGLWTLRALRKVLFGQRRFDQIVRNTGASRDILAALLRELRCVTPKQVRQGGPWLW
jgi:DNA-binding HxlR family transcriptional regulator